MRTLKLYARESVVFDEIVVVRDAAGMAVDITGWDFTADMTRTAGTVDIELATVAAGSEGFTVANGPLGQLRLRIAAETLAGIDDTTGFFTMFGDLLGTPPGLDQRVAGLLRLTVSTAGQEFGGTSYQLTLDGAGATALAAISAEVDRAELAADAAAAAGNYFPSQSAGQAGTTTGQLFCHPDGLGGLVYRERTSGASTIIGYAATKRILDRIAHVVEIVDFTADNSPLINAALADSSISTVMLPAGEIEIGSPILLQSNKRLVGAGDGVTVLKAKSTFAYTGSNNAGIFAQGMSDCSVADLTLQMSKVGWTGSAFTTRLCGIQHKDCTDFTVERVTVHNASGYAFWPVGTGSGANMTKRAAYRDVRSYNANVHIEPMRCEDITIDTMIYGDGDGDIPCEAAVHPLVFGSRITIRNVRGSGAYPGVNITVSGGTMENVTISDSRFICTSALPALIIAGQGNPVLGIKITGCHIESLGGNGTDIGDGDVLIQGSTLKGTSAVAPVCGLLVGGVAQVRAVNSIAHGHCTYASGQANGATNQSSTAYLHFDGVLRATAANGASAIAKGAVKIVLSPTTTLEPNPQRNERVFLEATGQVVATTVSAGASSSLSITLPAECLDKTKAFLGLTMVGTSSPTANINHAVDITQGTPFITVHLRGDHGGKTFQYYYRELF